MASTYAELTSASTSHDNDVDLNADRNSIVVTTASTFENQSMSPNTTAVVMMEDHADGAAPGVVGVAPSGSEAPSTVPSSWSCFTGLNVRNTVTTTRAATTTSIGTVDTGSDLHELKVCLDFVVNQRPECLGPLPQPLLNSKNRHDTYANASDTATNRPKHERKGMNKKRPRDKRTPDDEKLCLFILRGESCPHENEGTCKFSHDLDAYLRTKPQDLTGIQGGCPLFRIHGFCRYGICCRLATTHTTKDGTNVANKTHGIGASDSEDIITTMNVLDRDVLNKLRKNQYPFRCPRNPFQNKKLPEAVSKIFAAPPPLARDIDDDTSRHKKIDFRGKVYIAPLTTVGNLPFRRIMKHFGADITCGEMALATCLLEGKPTEWSLVKRHVSEDIFGVQLAAGHPDQFVRAAEVLQKHVNVDFLDLNLGCPLDIVCNKGGGAHLMLREKRLKDTLIGLCNTLTVPVTIKMRTGWDGAKPIAHKLVPHIQSWQIHGLSAIFIHGRSRLQRYSKDADWDYIAQVAKSQSSDFQKIPIIGNGDVFSYTDYEEKIAREGVEATAMLARGALIKPWLPTEIKERRHWDISAPERMDILKDFVRFGLEHWGSDQQGVNTTRRFLLEWLSFLCRYVPVALLDRIPQAMNQRPPNYMVGRSDLETLFLSTCSYDWVRISEMLLGPVPVDFEFEPKHKANSYPK